MLRPFNTLSRAFGNLAIWALLLTLAWIVDPHAAHAQAVTSYVRTDDGAIGAAEACNAAPLLRTFNVSDSFVIGDVDLGVIVNHTWRGDLRIRLTSPAGTTVQLVNGDINNISGNNFHVRLNDEGTQLVNTDGNTRNQSDGNNPPFQNNYIPNNSLSAFDGQNSNGTWTLEICDQFPSDDGGTFRYAELFLTDTPAVGADLSLIKNVSNATPAFGSTINFTLSLTNSGPLAATNVEVFDQLPVGFDLVQATGTGGFDTATGIWSIPSIASGQTLVLTLTGTVSAPPGVTITNFAEVNASDEPDIDSTPGNSSLNEDDDDSASFTVQGTRTAGTPPPLICPVGVTTFDWDAPGIVWNAGALNQTFNLAGIGDINFDITSNGVFVNDATFGGQSPAESNGNTGGSATSGNSLHQFLDFANRQQTATTVITLPTAVAGAQFTLFDIDFAANDFADQVTVTGSYQGNTVIPILTNGTANYVVGNTATGDVTSDNNQGNGNVEVTFNQPIDTITIIYGNAVTAPVVPDGQAITIHDIDFCTPQTQLSVTKVSSVISDPANTDPATAKAIPGALVEYVIQVSNPGVSDAGNVAIRDVHPGDVKLCQVSQTGGPIIFQDPGSNTGLTFDPSTDLEYLDNAGNPYSDPVAPDAQGCDAAIGGFLLTPDGFMNGGTSFTLRIRYRVIDGGPTP